MKSLPSLHNPSFSHIYIEKQALEYPDAKEVLKKFSKCRVIEIDDYNAIFSRSNQHFQTQKKSIKLILAVKKDQFIYDGSNYAPNFGLPNFYYNTLILTACIIAIIATCKGCTGLATSSFSLIAHSFFKQQMKY